MRRVAWVGLVAVALVGCGDDGGSVDPDAGSDAAVDGGMDAGDDAGGGVDAAMDAGEPDAGGDAAADDAGGDDAGGDDAGADDAATDAGDTDAAADGGGPRGGDTCDAALVIVGDTTLTDSTADASDDYSPSGAGCPIGAAATGGDRVYRIQADGGTAGTWTVTVTPDGDYDPMVYARAACESPDCVEGTVLNGPGEMEQITVDVAAGTVMWIVVDGELLSDGSYTVEFAAP